GRALDCEPIGSQSDKRPVDVGVVGLGYWGPNLARNFDSMPETRLRWVCDTSEESRARWAPHFRNTRTSGDLEELLSDPDLEAVAIATPVPTRSEERRVGKARRPRWGADR